MKHANHTREKHGPGARPALPHEKFPQVVEAIVQIRSRPSHRANHSRLGHATVHPHKTVRISLPARPSKTWLWARPPVLSPAPMQAVHSHEESNNTSVVQTLALRKNHMLIYIRVTNHGAARDHNRSEKQRKSPDHLEVIHPMLLIRMCSQVSCRCQSTSQTQDARCRADWLKSSASCGTAYDPIMHSWLICVKPQENFELFERTSEKCRKVSQLCGK